MFSRWLTGRRKLSLLLFLSLFVVLAACGSHPTVKLPPAPTATSTKVTFAVPTATPDTTRIPYPWPMQQRQNPYSGQTEWIPGDGRVFQELEKDFLTYWVWSGQAGPASFPFSPDPGQIALLATSDFSGQLQAYLTQIQSSGQVIAYLSAQAPVQPAIQTCTQDGLQCQSYYAFGSATKTIYNAQTGQILSQTGNIQIIFNVAQSYNKEMQRWQLSGLRSQELNG
jgi:predicted small lipoprotein YifL